LNYIFVEQLLIGGTVLGHFATRWWKYNGTILMQTMDSGLCGHKISRTLMEAFLQSWCDRGWPHARVFDFGILPGTGSIRAASVKSTGQGGGVSAAIWV